MYVRVCTFWSRVFETYADNVCSTAIYIWPYSSRNRFGYCSNPLHLPKFSLKLMLTMFAIQPYIYGHILRGIDLAIVVTHLPCLPKCSLKQQHNHSKGSLGNGDGSAPGSTGRRVPLNIRDSTSCCRTLDVAKRGRPSHKGLVWFGLVCLSSFWIGYIVTSSWHLDGPANGDAKCTNAQMHKCTNAQMHKCANAQMHNAQMHKCANARMRKCTNAQMHERTNAKHTDAQMPNAICILHLHLHWYLHL